MDLERWRIGRELTYEQLAALIGVSQARMARRYALGEQSPRPETVEQIRLATGGEVTPNDLHDSRIAWLKSKGLFHEDSLPAPLSPVTENSADHFTTEQEGA